MASEINQWQVVEALNKVPTPYYMKSVGHILEIEESRVWDFSPIALYLTLRFKVGLMSQEERRDVLGYLIGQSN